MAAALPRNAQGHLLLGGCDSVELAEAYGTPLYVYDEGMLRQRCRRMLAAFRAEDVRSRVVYSAKAFLCLAMAHLVDAEGLGIEVVSGGELYTVLQAGVSPEQILFTGNYKSDAELSLALEAGVSRLIVDNFHELERLSQLAGERELRQPVYLRVAPGVEAHTHHYIRTGQEDSKFGFDLGGGQAHEAARRVAASDSLQLVGLHCHIGSQIFDLEPFQVAARRMLRLAAEIRELTGAPIEELDMGGGLGSRYLPADDPPSIERFAAQLLASVREAAAAQGMPVPAVVVEPGRSIVNEAGVTLYTVGPRKELDSLAPYVMLDGGMTDNPRPSLYGARYAAVAASRTSGHAEEQVLAGKCCESGDILIKSIQLPSLAAGDIVAVLATGAYTYSMAGHYNMLPKPAVVFCQDGEARLVVERETYRDLLRRHVPPQGAPAAVAPMEAEDAAS